MSLSLSLSFSSHQAMPLACLAEQKSRVRRGIALPAGEAVRLTEAERRGEATRPIAVPLSAWKQP